MLNINTWPSWLAPTNAPLADEKIPEFETLVRSLVRVMRDSVNRPISYWEVTNELDQMYQDAGQLPRLWDLYARLAAAIKQEDPTATVGGPAFRSSTPSWFNGFMAANSSKADFLSWHYYRSGNPSSITDSAVATTHPTYAFANISSINSKYPGTKTWLTEYNIQWTWDPLEARHGTSLGALYQYNIIRMCQQYGLEGSMVWHLKGNAYGLIDDKDSIRTTGNFFLLGTRVLVGDLNKVDYINNTNGLDFMAVSSSSHKAIAVCNQTATPKTLVKNHLLFGSNTAYKRYIYQLQNGRFGIVSITQFEGDLVLPPYSITLLSTKALD
jgi:hypothetical protein